MIPPLVLDFLGNDDMVNISELGYTCKQGAQSDCMIHEELFITGRGGTTHWYTLSTYSAHMNPLVHRCPGKIIV